MSVDQQPCTPTEHDAIEAEPAVSDSSRWNRWAVVSLVALVFGLYWPTATYEFANWDDPWYVINNPLIKSWHPSNLVQVASQTVARNFAPVTIFSFLVDHSVWGLQPGGFHLTNCLWHAVNAVLVYVLLVQLTGSRFVGWTTAALFAVHPIQIETVAWISSRKGLLSGAFILSALICWLRPDRSAKQEVSGLLFFFLALMSKAIAVVVPAIVLMYDVLVRRQPFAEALARQVIPGLLAVWFLLLTMTAQVTMVGGVRGHLALNQAEIIAVDSVILWRYVGMLIDPSGLSVLYDPPTSGIAVWVALAAVAWAAVAFAAYRCRQRFPLIAFAAISAIMLLVPVLNFFPLTTLMNDRYLYLPCIPLFAVAAAGLRIGISKVSIVASAGQMRSAGNSLPVGRIANPSVLRQDGLAIRPTFPSPGTLYCADRQRLRMGPTGLSRALSFALIAIVIGFYGRLAQQHLPTWRNSLALWEQATERAPRLPTVQFQLADALYGVGESERAIAVMQAALVDCQPDAVDRKRILRQLADWQN